MPSNNRYNQNRYPVRPSRTTRRLNPFRRLGGFSFFFLIPIAVFLIAAFWIISWGSVTNTVTCQVNDKDRTTNSENRSDARVYTEDCGVFNVADDLLKGHFDSADTFSQITPGETYTFKTVGWRFPLFSIFPNIIEVSK